VASPREAQATREWAWRPPGFLPHGHRWWQLVLGLQFPQGLLQWKSRLSRMALLPLRAVLSALLPLERVSFPRGRVWASRPALEPRVQVARVEASLQPARQEAAEAPWRRGQRVWVWEQEPEWTAVRRKMSKSQVRQVQKVRQELSMLPVPEEPVAVPWKAWELPAPGVQTARRARPGLERRAVVPWRASGPQGREARAPRNQRFAWVSWHCPWTAGQQLAARDRSLPPGKQPAEARSNRWRFSF
jgi:hypothetical protein